VCSDQGPSLVCTFTSQYLTYKLGHDICSHKNMTISWENLCFRYTFFGQVFIAFWTIIPNPLALMVSYEYALIQFKTFTCLDTRHETKNTNITWNICKSLQILWSKFAQATKSIFHDQGFLLFTANNNNLSGWSGTKSAQLIDEHRDFWINSFGKID